MAEAKTTASRVIIRRVPARGVPPNQRGWLSSSDLAPFTMTAKLFLFGCFVMELVMLLHLAGCTPY
jgi:hypothetical protein